VPSFFPLRWGLTNFFPWGCLRAMFFLISATQVARITGMRHKYQALIFLYIVIFIAVEYSIVWLYHFVKLPFLYLCWMFSFFLGTQIFM
jgi:hypothetical protein